MLIELIFYCIFIGAMVFMYKEMKYANYKTSIIPSIVLTIIQFIVFLGKCINNIGYLFEFSSFNLFYDIGFLILVEIAFIFILIQYIKYNKKDKN